MTEQAASTPERAERWRPRHWSLTVKLVVLLLVPTVLALLLGTLRIADQAGKAADLAQMSRLVTLQKQVATLLSDLQQERLDAGAFVAADRPVDSTPLKDQFGKVDQSGTQARSALGGVDPTDDALVGVQRQQLVQALDQLPALRTLVTNSNAPASAVTVRYTELLGRLGEVNDALLRGINVAEVNGLAIALGRLDAAREEMSLQHAVLTAAAIEGTLAPPDAAEVAAAEARLEAALANFRAALDAGQRVSYAALSSAAPNVARARLVGSAVSGPADAPRPVPSKSEVSAVFDPVLQDVDKTESGVRQELGTTSDSLQTSASNEAGINSVILMLGLLLAFAIMVLIARNMIRSLRVLRNTALDVAERRLPQAVESMRAGEAPTVDVDPVPLDSRDEVGQVARAFDEVHGQAVRLAADQAALQANVNAMFVNLSRRSQALVERQLQLIEQLESNEQDPDQLSDLFRLDHLATRMRRNSENLLVLAGTDLSKRNVAPVPVIDVLRAAVSEIEQYQRIVVQPPPTITIVGRAASDLVHLLAELLDNAANFSPPDSQVVMSTTRTGDGSVLIEIADRGVGMTGPELGDANLRLSGPSEVDVSASRRMGLFVVGRLASRHGIGVRLGAAAGTAAGTNPGGLTATVTVPTYLIPPTASNVERPTGVGTMPPVQRGPQPAGPQAGPRLAVGPGGHPPTNGHTRPDSLSSLVAGNDGPRGPGGTPDRPGFTPLPPLKPGQPLPVRQPGTSLHPNGRPADQSRNGAQPHATADEQPEAGDTENTTAKGVPGDDETAPDTGGTAAEDAAPGDDAAADRGTAANSDDAAPGKEAAGRQGLPAPPTTPRRSVPTGATAERPSGDAGEPPSAAPHPPGGATPPPGARDDAAGPPQQAAPARGQAAAPQADPNDDLFAPNVPAVAEPGRGLPPKRPATLTQQQFEMGHTTPIFEEIASAWFRSNRPLPVNWETAQPGATPTPPPPAPTSPPASPAARPAPPAGAAGPQAPAPGPGASFVTAADDGWRAAEDTATPAVGRNELTAAGLPKRRPRARLVPGSAAGSAVLAASSSPTRTAEAVRGRLASYQQGVRQGREVMLRRQGESGEPGRPGTNETQPAPAGSEQDEEN
ncbi:sensor histidine kinase [Pseudonocardia asaccharolytica]|uniref:sensor histidine kinase n=2 Tax=Pseudonocardia asaccharolytica TaxID=54010 RepID=UPI000491DA97|nr:nitrate- and nitrite sensing domain-containing protein [Pseudonocardia asaccharolytica]